MYTPESAGITAWSARSKASSSITNLCDCWSSKPPALASSFRLTTLPSTGTQNQALEVRHLVPLTHRALRARRLQRPRMLAERPLRIELRLKANLLRFGTARTATDKH